MKLGQNLRILIMGVNEYYCQLWRGGISLLMFPMISRGVDVQNSGVLGKGITLGDCCVSHGYGGQPMPVRVVTWLISNGLVLPIHFHWVTVVVENNHRLAETTKRFSVGGWAPSRAAAQYLTRTLTYQCDKLVVFLLLDLIFLNWIRIALGVAELRLGPKLLGIVCLGPGHGENFYRRKQLFSCFIFVSTSMAIIFVDVYICGFRCYCGNAKRRMW